MTFNRNRTGIVGSTNPTPAVLGLIAINVVVFVASGFGKTSVIDRYGLVPEFLHGGEHQYYRLFDSMFLHLNLLHIAGNMVALLIVGPAVEVLLGRTRFLALYLVAGLGGGVAFYLIAPANSAAAGASGAIFGVMGAYVVLAARRHLPMQQVVALIIINLIIGFTGNIGWQAHLGGLAESAAWWSPLLMTWPAECAPLAREIAASAGATPPSPWACWPSWCWPSAPGHVNLG